MGDPTEHARDPDNDRCSPCPHVKTAVSEFQEKYGDQYGLKYFDIPCDGTVVTGNGDIGCDGHKNRKGQAEVANHIAPQLKEWMGWNDNSIQTLLQI